VNRAESIQKIQRYVDALINTWALWWTYFKKHWWDQGWCSKDSWIATMRSIGIKHKTLKTM